MKNNKPTPDRPLSENEKQKTPLQGEVKPAEARAKAITFAAQAKARMSSKKR